MAPRTDKRKSLTPSEVSAIIVRGDQAAKAMESGYVMELFERIDAAYRETLCSLRPSDVAEFTGYAHRRAGLVDVRNAMIADVEDARKYRAVLAGEPVPGARIA